MHLLETKQTRDTTTSRYLQTNFAQGSIAMVVMRPILRVDATSACAALTSTSATRFVVQPSNRFAHLIYGSVSSESEFKSKKIAVLHSRSF